MSENGVVKITFPDGNVSEYPSGVSVLDIAEKIGPRLAMAALAAKVNGKLVDVTFKISCDSQLQIITGKDVEGLEVLRHSAAHLFAQAILRLYPEVKLTIGPVVENGFYYDLDSDRTFSTQDFPAIELEMEKINIQDSNTEISNLELKRKELESMSDTKPEKPFKKVKPIKKKITINPIIPVLHQMFLVSDK